MKVLGPFYNLFRASRPIPGSEDLRYVIAFRGQEDDQGYRRIDFWQSDELTEDVADSIDAAGSIVDFLGDFRQRSFVMDEDSTPNLDIPDMGKSMSELVKMAEFLTDGRDVSQGVLTFCEDAKRMLEFVEQGKDYQKLQREFTSGDEPIVVILENPGVEEGYDDFCFIFFQSRTSLAGEFDTKLVIRDINQEDADDLIDDECVSIINLMRSIKFRGTIAPKDAIDRAESFRQLRKQLAHPRVVALNSDIREELTQLGDALSSAIDTIEGY